jgi:hypothetical protein
MVTDRQPQKKLTQVGMKIVILSEGVTETIHNTVNVACRTEQEMSSQHISGLNQNIISKYIKTHHTNKLSIK